MFTSCFTSWFAVLLVSLLVQVTGFYRTYPSSLCFLRIRNRIYQKTGRYDVVQDPRYQDERQTIQKLKIQELLMACKQSNIDIDGVLDRDELEYRLIVHHLLLKYGQDNRPVKSLSYSPRAYTIELEKEIKRLKKLPNDLFREEMFQYNITDIPIDTKERDDVIILIAKEKLKERSEHQKSMLQTTKMFQNIEAVEPLESDLFEEGDENDYILPNITLNQTVWVNDSVHFLKNSLNEIGKLTERLVLTNPEQVAMNYSSRITLNNSKPTLDDSKIKQLYQEALLLSSLKEAKVWINLHPRDTVIALLSLTGETMKKHQFTPLSELRDLFVSRLLQQRHQDTILEDDKIVDEVERDLVSYKIPPVKVEQKNTRMALRSSKKRRETLDDILNAEKSLFNHVFLSFLPRFFRVFISMITVIVNQILGIFAMDAIDWSFTTIPQLINKMPKYSKNLASAELPLLSFVQGVQKICELTFTWAGSNRYPSPIVATFVCSYTILNNGGPGKFIKTLLFTKFLTSILNQLRFKTHGDEEGNLSRQEGSKS